MNVILYFLKGYNAMAEKFVKPKRFTAKWWSYFWEYYKWYVITAVVIIISVIYTVNNYLNQPKYMYNMIYAGYGFIAEENKEAFKTALTEGYSSEDIGDGIEFTQLNFDDSPTADAQFQSAALSKLQLQFVTDETFLFLFDEKMLGSVLGGEDTANIWMPVSEWADEMSDEDSLYNEYAVCLKDSKLLEKCGINGEDIYVVLRYNYERDKNEDNEKRHSYSVEAANKLIEE